MAPASVSLNIILFLLKAIASLQIMTLVSLPSIAFVSPNVDPNIFLNNVIEFVQSSKELINAANIEAPLIDAYIILSKQMTVIVTSGSNVSSELAAVPLNVVLAASKNIVKIMQSLSPEWQISILQKVDIVTTPKIVNNVLSTLNTQIVHLEKVLSTTKSLSSLQTQIMHNIHSLRPLLKLKDLEPWALKISHSIVKVNNALPQLPYTKRSKRAVMAIFVSVLSYTAYRYNKNNDRAQEKREKKN